MKKNLFLLTMMFPFLFSTSTAFANDEKTSNGDSDVFRVNIFDTSMKKGVSCFRIPAIVTAKNGNLIAAIDERVPSCHDLLYNEDINIDLRISKDNGRTWSDIRTVVDFPKGESASDPSMVVDGKTGKVFLFYNYRNLKEKDTGTRLQYIMSKNNGKTWSKPRDITDDISAPETKMDFKFITSGRGCYTSDGKILHTVVNVGKALTVFYSNDHGKTWNFIDKGIRPADESKIIELPNGEWMINSRVNGAGMRYVHVSNNQGQTWETHPDATLVDPSCNGSIISYSSKREGDDKDRILFSNANDKKGRNNLTIRMSYDNGKTWAYSKTLHPGGAAYSSLTKLKDGRIAVFYEKDGCTINEVAIFDLDWLTDGADTFKKKK